MKTSQDSRSDENPSQLDTCSIVASDVDRGVQGDSKVSFPTFQMNMLVPPTKLNIYYSVLLKDPAFGVATADRAFSCYHQAEADGSRSRSVENEASSALGRGCRT